MRQPSAACFGGEVSVGDAPLRCRQGPGNTTLFKLVRSVIQSRETVTPAAGCRFRSSFGRGAADFPLSGPVSGNILATKVSEIWRMAA
jgi:hypothetical protein